MVFQVGVPQVEEVNETRVSKNKIFIDVICTMEFQNLKKVGQEYPKGKYDVICIPNSIDDTISKHICLRKLSQEDTKINTHVGDQ